MSFFNESAQMLAEMIDRSRTISIVTHLNPDPDTIGTGLGIYHLLRTHTDKRIEIVNASESLPMHLDFLPGYGRIKRKPDFDSGLLIACDCGSAKRLGVSLEGREVVNIDHHRSNERYGDLNVILPEYASASQVAYELFAKLYETTPQSASCFYAALLSDTRYFTTATVDKRVFEVATALVESGADPVEIASHFTQRRSLASLRVLERALHSLHLYREGKVGVMYISPDDIVATGAAMPDMEGIVDYARSLAIVRIAVLLIENSKGDIRVSMRSKGEDVSSIASHFGGGGHTVAAGFTLQGGKMQEIVDTILDEISKRGLIDG